MPLYIKGLYPTKLALRSTFPGGIGLMVKFPSKSDVDPPTCTPPTSTTTLAKEMGSLVALSIIFPLSVPDPVCENTNTLVASTKPKVNSKFLNIPYNFMLDYNCALKGGKCNNYLKSNGK